MSDLKKVLIFQGGWEGHEPTVVSARIKKALETHACSVDVADNLQVLVDEDLLQYDLIVPNWTMGQIENEALGKLSTAIKAGVGLAGAHGGMGDSFRGSLEFNWMVGGQFLGHPHVAEYTVSLTGVSSDITKDLPDSFVYNSEQYYMMVDPGVTVLADTVYRWNNTSCRMPVIWTRQWGEGRVFYSALGHANKEYDEYPFVFDALINGLKWAMR